MKPADAAQPPSSPPLHLRVFLASPGDVADERALALHVLEQLQYDPLLRGKITLETVAWDKPGAGAPMLATMTPQEAIAEGLPKPSECDIVIVIFWSRMGTPLPADWKKPDGSRYLSGTEWEYLNALEAAEQHDKPAILVYRRSASIALDPTDPAIDMKLQQWRLVQQFFTAFQNPDGSIQRGYNPYPAPEAFREQLNLHLRSLVRDILEREAPIAAIQQPVTPALPVAGPPLWPGSPFPGLRAFTPADAPIFFGRGRETDGLVSKLADPAVRFLAVVGASGSGKSSLVAAGLIPRLLAGALPGSQDWVWVRFTPGEVGDNPFMALAVPFKEALQRRGQQPRALANKLEKNPATLVELRDLALAGKPDWTELLLFIDQFEELFTLVAPPYVGPFIALLNQAARTERIRVVATLRADFYPRCVEWPVLAELLRTGSYPLAAPGLGALHEMITRPAERAGLTFERGLVERLLDDTGTEPGALALLAFALAELYAARTAEGHLTWAAYQHFNGVQGAIAKRADDTFNHLEPSIQAKLGEVFQELVAVNEQGAASRRRALVSQVTATLEMKELVSALTQARLLVTSRGEGNDPVVEVAHEALIHHWQRLKDWLDQDRKFLLWRQRLRGLYAEWRHARRDPDALLRGPMLVEAEGWLALRDVQLSSEERDYIIQSAELRKHEQHMEQERQQRELNAAKALAEEQQKRAEAEAQRADEQTAYSKRLRWFVRAMVVVGLGLLMFSGTMVWLYVGELTVKHGTSMLLAGAGFYHPDEPAMVKISAGAFWMGSHDEDQEANGAEKPRHQVTIPKPFEIGQYEVTFDEYDQFAYATGRALLSDQGGGRGRRPVINVSWEEAVVYAAWLSRMTGKQYRLASEAEWEYAARAGSETSRYWGDDPQQGCQYANGADQSVSQAGYDIEAVDCNDGYVYTAEVGSFKANDFGLHDMLGNVWEWVQDCWHDTYKDAPTDGSAWEGEDCQDRVLRGGSWYTVPLWLRAATRLRYLPSGGYNFRGFRLARTL